MNGEQKAAVQAGFKAVRGRLGIEALTCEEWYEAVLEELEGSAYEPCWPALEQAPGSDDGLRTFIWDLAGVLA
jgi:hypothetical protein